MVFGHVADYAVLDRIPVYFQFPVGIRWCSDIYLISIEVVEDEIFQFPVGIRWCSDVTKIDPLLAKMLVTFNSLWELDGVRT